MSVLRLNVLGPPEVFHDGSRLTFALRKAQALLLYLAVEGGMHLRSKLAAFLWPDSEPHDARNALRNALALLRRLLADASPAGHSHLLSEGELLGLNPQAPLELDLAVVQQAYTAAQRFSTPPSEPQRAALVTQVQQALALIRGLFLDGFWLREETGFDTWHEQQRQQWQVRLQLLCERLSSWQEAGGELEPARATLLRWLALDPLAEEASQRLMRVHLARGDASAALQVYATLRARLAEELQVKPSAETVALAERIRATATARGGSAPAHRVMATMESRPPSELVAPLVGRAAAFGQLVGRYQQARQGQPQAVLLVGEAGIGKTRLAGEFVAWASAQGAQVLRGQAFEMGGRLSYQPLVEALRPRLEEENAPEDLLEDLWLAELSRLLPELRVRYPDLPAPTEDELTAKLRLFEAVARLLDALAQRSPLVLLLDDLHWVDGASLDVVRYLGRYWKGHSSRVLLLGTLRSEGLEPKSQLSTQLADLGRDLPVSQVPLQALSQAETLQLIEAIAGEGAQGTSSGGEQRHHGTAPPSTAGASPSPERKAPLVALGDFLFAQTGGQPLYLLETLKLLREREWLVPRLAVDGTWRLELDVEIATAVAQERSRRALLPPSVHALIQARLAKLAPAARQLVMASAVLGTQATAQRLWQVAEVGVQAGVESLEEAVSSGILREEEAGVGRLGGYHFAHDLIRDVVYTELGEARRQVLHQRTLALLRTEGARASELAYHALAAGEAEAAYRSSVQAGIEAVAVFAVEDAIEHYEQARALLQDHQRIQTELSAAEVERLYTHLGQAYAFQNAWDKAQEAYEELLAYAQHQRQFTLASMTLNRLAILVAQQANDKPQVRALLDEAWQMAQTSHDQKSLAETEWNRAQITASLWEDPERALPHGEQALSLTRALHDQELEGRCLFTLGVIHLLGGDFEETMHCAEASLALYAALGNEPTASRELSLPSFAIGAPLTQPLTNRASEAMCWILLASAQVNGGQVQSSIRSGRRALALSQEIKNVWAQVNSTLYLAYGLLEVGSYEAALVLTQEAMALARTFPLKLLLCLTLAALGSTYHALQQWEEAHSTLTEAEAMAEVLDLGLLRVLALSQLCMHYAEAGEWEAAYRYAVKAIALRKSSDVALILLDFSPQYETEALLRGGDERQAREEVHRLRERLGPYRRFRIPYLRSLAVLAAWEGQREQAIGHLREAAQLAADLGLPAERWQIQAALGSLYEAGGEQGQAHTTFGEAARIIGGLAEGIKDETLRARFLAGPQIHPVVQHAQSEASPVPKDQAEPSGVPRRLVLQTDESWEAS
jgi:DNA-binding SARP family transcriptional activator/tetratricopeptide (TPR) repeat protein